MSRPLGLTLGIALSVSCAPVASPRPASDLPRSADLPAKNSLPGPPPDAKEQALQAKLTEALTYVSSIRGLHAKRQVAGRLISREEIEQYLKSELESEAPEDMMQATEALLYGLGTVPVDFDYRKTVISLMTQQLLGFYDPKRKTFFVGGDLAGQEADITLWHELVHALQDQHYDLTRVTDWEADRGDAQAAVHALAEGDATSTMLDAMLAPRGSTALDVPEGLMRAESILGAATGTAPPILIRSLVAPYVDGLAFTNELRRRGGFAAVDEAWRALPVSTEQVLHPDKYLAREAPLVVDVPTPPPHAPGLVERYHDIMGEQTLRLFFQEWLPGKTAVTSASDWGGDRIAVFSDDARETWAFGWHLRFDSAEAGKRALLAFARSARLTELGAENSTGPEEVAATEAKLRGDKMCRPRTDQGPLALVRRGADLAVAVGPFRRNSVAVSADPDCSSALAWASIIVNH
jgi:hypothetical protein